MTVATIAELLNQAARDLDEPFRAGDLMDWFRAHAPGTKPSSIRAHIQALTANATNRLENNPVLGARPAVLYRLEHGLYRRWRPEDATNPTPRDRAASTSAPREVHTASSTQGEAVAVHEWSWDGNVQSTVISWLAGRGWRIRRAADTRSRERGTDIVAERAGRKLHVEVKGWPSPKYINPARSGEQKRSTPSVQARAWFADALMHGLRLRDANPDDDVAIAVPDTATYCSLAASIRSSLAAIQVTVMRVDHSGEITGTDPQYALPL